MSRCGFLTCRPDLVVVGDLCASAVNLVGTSAFVAVPVGQFQANVDSWVRDEMVELQDHAALGAWADHLELR